MSQKREPRTGLFARSAAREVPIRRPGKGGGSERDYDFIGVVAGAAGIGAAGMAGALMPGM